LFNSLDVAYNGLMTNALLFMLGITESYGMDVFRLVLAVWFFSVGYLLYKRANRALLRQRSNVTLDLPAEMACLTPGTYHTTGA
jgi:hypothetical protein